MKVKTEIFTAFVLVAAAQALAHADYIIGQGDIGLVQLSLTNSGQTGVIQAARLTVVGAPNGFTVTSNPSTDVSPGQQASLGLSYAVDPNALTGTFSIKIVPAAANNAVLSPALAGQTVSVQIVQSLPFRVYEIDRNNETPIADGAITHSQDIFVDAPYYTASISLTGGPSQFNSVPFAPGEIITAEFDNLSGGQYTAIAYDSDGAVIGSSRFTVQPLPAIYISDPYGTKIWDNFAGNSAYLGTNVPTVVAVGQVGTTGVSLVLHTAVPPATGDPLTSLTITGPGIGLSIPNPPKDAVLPYLASLTKPGIYTVFVSNASGGTTSASINVETYDAKLCAGLTTGWNGDLSFTASGNSACASASAGLKSSVELDPTWTAEVGARVGLAGITDVPVPMGPTMTDNDKHRGVQRNFSLLDAQNNSLGLTVQVSFGETSIGGLPDPGSISWTSPEVNFQSSDYSEFLPGSVLGLSSQIDPTTGGYTKVPAATMFVSALPAVTKSLPIGDFQEAGSLTLLINSVKIYDQAPVIVSSTGVMDLPPVAVPIPALKCTLTAAATKSAPTTVLRSNCLTPDKNNPGICLKWIDLTPTLGPIMAPVLGQGVSVGPRSQGSGIRLYSQDGAQKLKLSDNFEVDLTPAGNGSISGVALIGATPTSRRYQALPANTAYHLTADVPVSGQATVTIKYDSTRLTGSQISGIRMLQATNSVAGNYKDITAFAGGGSVTGVTSSIVPDKGLATNAGVDFMVVAPAFDGMLVVQNGPLTIASNDPAVTLAGIDSNAADAAVVLGSMLDVGLYPGTGLFKAGPDGRVFNPPAVVEASFTDAQLAAAGVGPSTLTMYQIKADGTRQKLPGQLKSEGTNTVSALVPSFSSYFGVFGRAANPQGPPPLVRDTTPPQTTLSFSAANSTDSFGNFLISSGTLAQLTAVDPIVPGAITSGVAGTFYALDQSSASPPSSYAGPFSSSISTHTLTFSSVDNAGNAESSHTINFVTALSTSVAAVNQAERLTVASLSSTSAEISWNPDGNPLGAFYSISYGPVSSASVCPASAANLTQAAATFESDVVIQGLSPNTAYQFVVCSQGVANGCANSVLTTTLGSGAGSQTTPAFTFCGGSDSPAAAAVVGVSSSAAVLAWDPNFNPWGTPYTVFYGATPGSNSCGVSSGSLPFSLSVATPAAAIEGLSPRTSYTFIVCNPAAQIPCGSPIFVKTGFTAEGLQPNPQFGSCAGEVPSGSAGGLALAADNSGNIWEVVEDNGIIKLAKSAPKGTPLASSTLPNASPGGFWSVSVDASGSAVAVGSDQTSALAVYRAAPSGVLLSSAVYNGNAVAFDSTDGTWISGAAVGPQGYSLALLKYDPVQNLITLTTTYSRGAGADGGFGADAAGNIWVVGFSSNPAAVGPFHVDLALWEFDPTGTTLLAGPFTRPGYGQDVNQQSLNAKLVVSSSSIYIAATRLSNLGNEDLAFLRYDLSGRLLAEKAWHARPAADVTPLGIAFGPAGDIVISGSVSDGNAARSGLWRYDASAGLISAQTVPGVAAANDVDLSGANLWLAVDASSAPFLFNGAQALAGAQGTSSDVLPPRSQLAFGKPYFVAASTYVASASPISLTSIDDLSKAGDGLGIGVAKIYYAVDGGSFTAYAGPFSLTRDGAHPIRYYSVDVVGNAETPQTSSLTVDNTPPVTQISFSAVLNGSAGTSIPSAASISLAAQDAGSGVAQTLYAVDGSSFSIYLSSFALPGGFHTVSFNSIDNLGNRENVQTSSLTVVSPSTGTSPGGREKGLAIAVAPDGKLWEVGSDNGQIVIGRYGPAGLEASQALGPDPQDGSWSVRFDTAGGVYAVGASSGPLSIGTDLVVYKLSSDALPISSVAFHGGVGGKALAWDATGDLWITGFLQKGSFNDGSATLTMGLWRYCFHTGLLSLTTTYSRGGPADAGFGIRTLGGNIYVDGYTSTGSFTTPSLGFALWEFDAQGHGPIAGPFIKPDYLRNVNGEVNARLETTSGTLYAAAQRTGPGGENDLGFIRYDASGRVLLERYESFGPSVSLAPKGAALDAQGNIVFAVDAAVTQNGVTSNDSGIARYSPAGDFLNVKTDNSGGGGVSGIAALRSDLWLAVDGSTAPHRFAPNQTLPPQDVLVSSAALDNLPPVTTAAIGSPYFTAPDGTKYVTTATVVALLAVDPPNSDGSVGSGVARLEVSIDSGPFTAYASSAALTFAEGRHAIIYRAVDNANNIEAAHALALRSDATPPVTSFIPSGALFISSGQGYAPASYYYSLTAQDPVANGVASGVASSSYRVSPAAVFTAYSSTFGLTEGIRRVDFQSQDNVSNLELLKSATVFVDATAPVSSVTIIGPAFNPGGGAPIFVSTRILFSLAAVDPVVQGVASGVSGISFSTGLAASSAAYANPFGLPPPEGFKTVSWFAVDNVGNTEVSKSTSVFLDATPPVTSLAALGGHQFPGPDSTTFYASLDTRLALVAVDPPINGGASGLAFTRWQDNNGPFQLSVSTLGLAEGAHLLAYQSQDRVQNLEVPRSTNVWIDATPPATAVSIGSPTFTAVDGTIYVSTYAPISFAAADPALPTGQPGSGLNHIEFSLDGGSFTLYASSFSLAEGRHVILYRAIDNLANIETAKRLALQSDATPPISSLAIGQPQFRLSNILLVSSHTPFSIAAFDPLSNNVASGVKDAFYRVSDIAPGTAAFQLFTATFTLSGADVNKIVEFYSRDNVLNAEIAKSSAVLLDSTPPELALLSPGACDSGICRVVKGKFPVLGTARDLHFASYRLEFAAGQDAASGFAGIASGNSPVSSGTLGVWDTSSLSGWQTLRLWAADLVENVSILAINVFVGDPGELLILGNHEVFNMPEGVAVGGTGNIYVADTNDDQIKVFSSTGGFLAAFGSAREERDERHDFFGEDQPSTTTLRLNKPKGVAVDGAGNVYVADTNGNRVLKLSPEGKVLFQLGRRPGRKPAEFNKPSGVALDAAGGIYVSDTENRRVQIFGSSGAFSSAFALPPLPRSRDDDHDDKDEDRSDLGKPVGIAIDASGLIYVADPKGRRALEFDRAGKLGATIPIEGRPLGIAVTPDGNCLLVSDEKQNRILKFDRQGNANLAFGARGRFTHDGFAPLGIVFHKPAGLALDASQNLYVADRNNSRVQEFSLPTGKAPSVVPTPGSKDRSWTGDMVRKEEGGKVEREDRTGVLIPPHALSEDMIITISRPGGLKPRTLESGGLKPVSAPVQFGPEGIEFRLPVTVTLPYNPAMAGQFGAAETDLKMHRFKRDTGQWEALDSSVDRQNRTVSARTLRFSLYQVFAIPPMAKPAADPAFAFCDLKIVPSVAHRGQTVQVFFQVGQADMVEIQIQDADGKLVHNGVFSAPQLADIGNGKGSQFTYEHDWSVGDLPQGVYILTVTARKSGQTDIRKATKIGVVRP